MSKIGTLNIVIHPVREFFQGRDLSETEINHAKGIRAWGEFSGTVKQLLIADHLENMNLFAVSVTQTVIVVDEGEFTATTTTQTKWCSTSEAAIWFKKDLLKKVKASVKAQKALLV